MVKKNDEIFELVCISHEKDNEDSEFSLGHYSSQEIANEQKVICEKEAEESNYYFEYEVRRYRIIK